MIAGRHSMIHPGVSLPFDSAVAWLEGVSTDNGDGPWIDTGIKLSNNPIIEVSVQPTDDSFSWVAGCRRFNSPSCYCNMAIVNTTRYARGVYKNTTYDSTAALPRDSFSTMRMSHTALSVNGTAVATYNKSIGTEFSTGPNLALFNLLQTGGATQTGIGLTGRIAWAKVWNDDGATLVGDFVAVRVGTTGFMFNRVTGELLGATNGTLSVGPDTSYQQGGVNA